MTSVRLFRLTGANGKGEQENAVITVPATGERYWRLQVDTCGDGLGADAPESTIGWRLAMVACTACGNMPFTLAVAEVVRGNPVVRADLLAGASPAIAQAQFGAMSDLPINALTVEPPGGRRRQWVLWGVPLAAVAVLGGMAQRLFRALSTPPDAST